MTDFRKAADAHFSGCYDPVGREAFMAGVSLVLEEAAKVIEDSDRNDGHLEIAATIRALHHKRENEGGR